MKNKNIIFTAIPRARDHKNQTNRITEQSNFVINPPLDVQIILLRHACITAIVIAEPKDLDIHSPDGGSNFNNLRVDCTNFSAEARTAVRQELLDTGDYIVNIKHPVNAKKDPDWVSDGKIEFSIYYAK